MPLNVESLDRDYYIVVLIFKKRLWVFGYAGAFCVTDMSNVILMLATGNIVAMPGASARCFFLSTSAALLIYSYAVCVRCSPEYIKFPSMNALAYIWLRCMQGQIC